MQSQGAIVEHVPQSINFQPRQINVIPGADVDDAGGKSAGHLVVTSGNFIKISTNTNGASREDSLFLHRL